MRFKTLATASVLAGMAAFSAEAGSLTITGLTIGAPTNTTITVTPAGDTGGTIATGFQATDGVSSFIAWCLDLEHTLSVGGPYSYMPTATPFASSFLAAGATGRVQSVFDANYGGVDPFDAVEAAAFQLALWEVGYDSDFSLTTGAFQGAGAGANAAAITAAATGYLAAASGYGGTQRFDVTYLENTDQTQRQNLVTASPVPLPAAGPLLIGGGALLGALRRRARRRAA